MNRSRKIALAVILPALVIGMFCGGALVAQHAYAQRIFNGISIGGIDVSGMTTTEATEKLQHAVSTFLDAGIAVSLDGKVQVIPLIPGGASDPDLIYELAEINVGELVQHAYELGRTNNKIQNFFAPLQFILVKKTNISPSVSFAENRISDAIRQAFPDAESPGTATDFSITLSEEEISIKITDAVAGSAIDMHKALATLSTDAEDLHLKTLPLYLIERSTLISREEATTLIPNAITALKKAPYTLTFSNDNLDKFTYEITQKDLVHWLQPEKNSQGIPELSLNVKEMDSFLKKIHADIDIAPQNAQFTVEGDRVTTFVGSRDGLIVDDEQLFKNLKSAFSADGVSPSIPIAVVRKAPETPIETLNTYGIKEILGVGYSSFANSPSNRRTNIRHGAEKLNGILIPPGETLSLLEKLKPFTTADGYLPELVIKGDAIVPEIGGGLCQIGTTTFRAALNSGLHIAERRNHSLVVSYYNDPSNGNPGTDATIYDPAPDLKIKNDTAHYIMLATEVDNEKSELHFTFWGTSDGRKGSYSPPEVLSWTGYGEKITKETTALAPGTIKCQSAHPGATTTFDYTIIWADGSTTKETFGSSYRALPEICLVGVANVTELPENELQEPLPVE